jgi:hypothetical protein
LEQNGHPIFYLIQISYTIISTCKRSEPALTSFYDSSNRFEKSQLSIDGAIIDDSFFYIRIISIILITLFIVMLFIIYKILYIFIF